MRSKNSGVIDLVFVSERIKQVVGDEPKDFAFRIGVCTSAVYNYTEGRRIPSTEVLFRIATVTGKPMEWFLSDNPNARFDFVK